MALVAGVRLGSYEILAPLGAGGMGEVYRAKDTKLGRDVAVKVLPQAFAADQDRMTRFQREAHLLASLNHPHIASIYGLEESDSTRALVMELVEGPTLQERIAQGAISIDDALPIAKQIAEALEYAHERGIVHRDLKPANVKLTTDGAVKILDFGLAKALADDPASSEVANSPTLSAVATRTGIILGTAAYMSPEQAKGKSTDRRSDIWSFGVVLYEMLSGRRLYTGETAADTLAAVLKTDPDWARLPAGLPHGLQRLLRRCLDRDVRRRTQAIGEARIAIEDLLAGHSEAAPATPLPMRRAGPWIALALAGGAVAIATISAPSRPDSARAAVRLSVELGADASLVLGAGPAAILSPDGKLLAFTARRIADQPPQLYIRRLDQLQASSLAGTEGAGHPFFSPDSQWLGFFADGKLKKVAASGGAVVSLCAAPYDQGGAWSEDGTIIFAPYSGGSMVGGLHRVSSAGGTPELLTRLDKTGEGMSDRWPQALPGGNVMFTSGARGNFENASIVVQSLAKGPRKVLQQGGYYGRYLPSGHLAYLHEGTVFAASFDIGRLERTGPPVPVLEGVAANAAEAGAQLAFSDHGTAVFLPGPSRGVGVPIQWMNKRGMTEPMKALAANFNSIHFSPDGQRLAVDISERGEVDVWVYEWGRDTMSRLTFDPADDMRPVWTPDGDRIAFASRRGDKAAGNLYWQRADGTGQAERLTESTNNQTPSSWHPSGRFLAFNETGPQTAVDIMILPMEGGLPSNAKPGKPTAFLQTPALEAWAVFSPDGNWLAYQSDESGRLEIYVRPFPGVGGKRQISTNGGVFPTWSRKRKELLYRSLDSTLMVAPFVVEGDSFRAEKPQPWSHGLVPYRGGGNRSFDLHPDGERVAVLKAMDEPAGTNRNHVVLFENFFDELRRLAPPVRR